MCPTVLIDTNIPMYAGGAPHPLREPCQTILLDIATGKLDAVTDAEVLQEILHRYIHIGARAQGLKVFDHFRKIMAGRILPIRDADVAQARWLADEHPTLTPRDLIHLAIMKQHELETIITADKGFSSVQGIRRLAPEDYR